TPLHATDRARSQDVIPGGRHRGSSYLGARHRTVGVYSAVMRTWRIVSALLCAVLATSTATVPAQTAPPLRVYWIDVEGGAATLIVTPAGESILVDAGNPGARDPGRIAKTAKETARLQRIDYMVVTHLHNDHFGGVADLAGLIPIGTLYDNGIDNAPETERAQATVPAYKAAAVGKRVVIKPGDVLPLKSQPGAGLTRLAVIAARQTVATSAAGKPNAANCANATEKPVDTTDNANSVVMVLNQGSFRMFLGGDTTWNVEARLVCPSDRIGTVEVYQSVHHGLDL